MSVWKKSPPPNPRPFAETPAPKTATEVRTATGTATIGPSITIKGDVHGEEDLMIEGRIEGEIRLQDYSVTVGRRGRVHADVHAKSIRVEGEVKGNLWGQEEVIIRQTGKVEGNLTAPRVTLEDGSSFRGAIDMQTPRTKAAADRSAVRPERLTAIEPAARPQTAGPAPRS